MANYESQIQANKADNEYILHQPYMGNYREAMDEQKGFTEGVYQDAVSGESSAAQQQLSMGLGQAQRNAASMAVARGSSPLAQRQAIQQGGQMASQANMQSAMLRAQEMQAAAGLHAGTLGQATGYGMTEAQMQQQRDIAQMQHHAQMQALEEGVYQADRDYYTGMIGSGVGAALGMISDVNAKTEIEPMHPGGTLTPIGDSGTDNGYRLGARSYYLGSGDGGPSGYVGGAPAGAYTGADPMAQPAEVGSASSYGVAFTPQFGAQKQTAFGSGLTSGMQAGGALRGSVLSDREAKDEVARVAYERGANDVVAAQAMAARDRMAAAGARSIGGLGARAQSPSWRDAQLGAGEGMWRDVVDYAAPPSAGSTVRDAAPIGQLAVQSAPAMTMAPQPRQAGPAGYIPTGIHEGEYGYDLAYRPPSSGAAVIPSTAAAVPSDARAKQEARLAGRVEGLVAGLEADNRRTEMALGRGASAELPPELDPAAGLRGPPPRTPEDQTLESLRGYTYRYKPEYQQALGLPGDRRYGIMAQDLEQTPLGSTMVQETPAGKAIDGQAATGASLALMGRLAQRDEEQERRSVLRDELLARRLGGM